MACLMPNLAILFTCARVQGEAWGGGVVQAHKSQGGQLHAQRGLIMGIKGNKSTFELGGIIEVAMWDFDLAWVLYPTMLCCF